MYYRINKEPNGEYLTEAGERVALLSSEKVPSGYLHLFTELPSDEEAMEYFNLTYDPISESEPEE